MSFKHEHVFYPLQPGKHRQAGQNYIMLTIQVACMCGYVKYIPVVDGKGEPVK